MFTRQHYKAIANIVNRKSCVQLLSDNPGDYVLKSQLVEALADFFEQDNERKSEHGFINAEEGSKGLV